MTQARERGVRVELTATGGPDEYAPAFRDAVRVILARARGGDSVLVRWRPGSDGRLGNVAVLSAGPRTDWQAPDVPAGRPVRFTVSTDELPMPQATSATVREPAAPSNRWKTAAWSTVCADQSG